MRLAFEGILGAFAIAAVLLVSGGATVAFAVPGPASTGAAVGIASAHPGAPTQRSPSTPSWNPRGECPAAPATWHGTDPPTAVQAALQSACPFEPDQASLSFLSNASGSGGRVAFTVALPAGTASPATALTSFGLGMWLSGVPCSLDGAAFLNVQLEPPYHYAGANGSANWTVQAPVDDLVPAGSCDPQCQNATALYSLEGTPYCEDDAVDAGVGGPTVTGWGGFVPGDQLNVTFVGAYQGTDPLTVYLNDTTHPSADLVWSYGAGVTVDHQILTPFAPSAGWSPMAWGYGVNVQADVQNCPTLSADAAAPCDSYDAPAWNAVAAPTIVQAAYWNATTLTYANGFDWTATASSTGGCAAVACSDFTTFGGTGAYPFWSLRAFDGASAWSYGQGGVTALTSWGGAAQFAASGAPTYAAVAAVAMVGATQIGNAVYLDAVAADPGTVQAVEFGAFWCFSGATPTVATTAGTLTASLVDTAADGNWTGSFSTHTDSGTFNAWARAESFGGTWSAPSYLTTSVTGVTGCTLSAPAAPAFTAANVSAAGGGFVLNWTASSGSILGYTVLVNWSGPTYVVPLGNVTHALVDLGLNPSVSYAIQVQATNFAHLSTDSLVVSASPTTVLGAGLSTAARTYWVGNADVTFDASASGGTAPYTYQVAFGDGSVNTTTTPDNALEVTHDYAGYFGTAAAQVTVLDAAGESATSAPVLVPILATPLAVNPSIAAGAVAVNVSWLLPASPAGSVTAYTVFTTTNAALAPTMSGALAGGAAAVGVTITFTSNLWDQFAVPVGTTVWAEVVAWDGYGAGTLPASGGPHVATTVNLTTGPIQSTPPGGAAPFTDALSDFVVNGTNDAITQSIYAAGFNTSGPSTLTPSTGGTWVNATLALGSPGLHVVILHVADQFADFALQITDVYVSAGGPLTVALSAPGPAGWTGWAGTALTFRAQASGGPGPDAFTWAFGDGGVATGANVTYTYPAPGNYTISVTATDATSGGAGTRTQTMTVFAPPTVAIQSRPGPNGSLSWAFTALTTGGSGVPSLSWSFGDGTVASGVHVSHDYGAPGTYTVNVSSVDPTGRSATAMLVLTLGGGGSGGGGSGTYLGAAAATWFGAAIGLAVLAAVLALALVVVARARAGRPGSGIARWKSTDDDPRSDRPGARR